MTIRKKESKKGWLCTGPAHILAPIDPESIIQTRRFTYLSFTESCEKQKSRDV